MTITYPRTTFPRHVLIQQMDRARRMEEDARRLHDQLAYEVGFERVRINHVQPFDLIEANEGGTIQVQRVSPKVDPSGIGEWVIVHAGNGLHEYDEGQFVTRYLPTDTKDAF